MMWFASTLQSKQKDNTIARSFSPTQSGGRLFFDTLVPFVSQASMAFTAMNGHMGKH